MRLGPLAIVLLGLSATAAGARGMIVPIPDEDGPGSERPPAPPQAPAPSSDRNDAAPAGVAGPPSSDGRPTVVWHVTNRADKSCLDVPTGDLGAEGDLAKIRTLLPAASFVIAQGKCAR
jgi:hypothetical protein